MKQKGQTIIMLRAKKYCAVAVQSKASSFIRKLSFSLRICKKSQSTVATGVFVKLFIELACNKIISLCQSPTSV